MMEKQGIGDVEMKKLLLDMAKELIKICEEHDLRIYASGGSLLGAVRHKGFIPWDDDMDFHMFRNDYDKLISIMKDKDGRYKLACYLYDKKYMYPFVKFYDSETDCIEYDVDSKFKLGLYIDIFPVDGLGDDVVEAKEHLKTMSVYVKASRLCRGKVWSSGASHVKKIAASAAKCLCKLYGAKRLNKKIEFFVRKYDIEKSRLCGEIVDSTDQKRICPKKWFEQIVYLPFEDIELPCPAGYHEYLTSYYGDYMTPPPVENQVSNHNMYVCYKED